MYHSNQLDKPAVITNIEQLQRIISRMAANSASCKSFAVTVCAAILTISEMQGVSRFNLCVATIGLIWIFDSYYLGLELRFKKISQRFIDSVSGAVDHEASLELFNIPKSSVREQMAGMLGGMVSLSTTPFYVLISIVFYFSYEFNLIQNSYL